MKNMETIEERANKAYPIFGEGYADNDIKNAQFHAYVKGATEQKAIDEVNPSDAVIMRILNAIGYEEESWIPIVRKNLKVMEE